MAKKKSFPAKPKSKNLDVLKAWEKKCADVKKFNDGIDKETAERAKVVERVKKMKAK
ncbi:hypothetical protein [Fibrella aquatilis]|uniref:Uncharacterized protein n=1 Tax=Fibrella aquatilis TaxID=2817059 RepID=A0A939JZ20_9BACT|nr:hypothetical protein [Fibrella aquatilis]MBO0934597.1 hypothetical protein [Fibrella aquatilis]